MKVLFVIKTIKNFSYHSSTIGELCRRGHTVRVIFPMKREQDLRGHGVTEAIAAAEGRLTVERGPTRQPSRATRVIHAVRELRSYASYLRRSDQSPFYGQRWLGYLEEKVQKAARHPLARALLKAPGSDSLFRVVDLAFPVEPRILELVREAEPDVVVGSPANMRHSSEVEYLKAARRLGIPTVIPVLSWDNLSTKGLFHVIPDKLLAWNEAHREQAVRIHGVPKANIEVTGSPFFDKWWADETAPRDREAFCRKVGLDPAKPFLLYLGSSISISNNEWGVIGELREALRGRPEFAEMQILVRPHPSNAATYAEIPYAEVAVWPRGGSLPDSETARADFRESVAESVAALGLNTSGMLDAIILGKPCYTILEKATAITQEQAAHFQELLRADALYTATSAVDCVTQLALQCSGEDPKKKAREDFVRAFIRPRGPAGAGVARAIEEALGAPRHKYLGLKLFSANQSG